MGPDLGGRGEGGSADPSPSPAPRPPCSDPAIRACVTYRSKHPQGSVSEAVATKVSPPSCSASLTGSSSPRDPAGQASSPLHQGSPCCSLGSDLWLRPVLWPHLMEKDSILHLVGCFCTAPMTSHPYPHALWKQPHRRLCSAPALIMSSQSRLRLRDQILAFASESVDLCLFSSGISRATYRLLPWPRALLRSVLSFPGRGYSF